MDLLPSDQAERIRAIISDRESTATALMTTDFITAARETTVCEILRQIPPPSAPTTVFPTFYIVSGGERLLAGVVDLRDLVLAADETIPGDLMVSPVVAAQQDDMRDDLAELFAKYHFRMIPIVDARDHLLGRHPLPRHHARPHHPRPAPEIVPCHASKPPGRSGSPSGHPHLPARAADADRAEIPPRLPPRPGRSAPRPGPRRAAGPHRALTT